MIGRRRAMMGGGSLGTGSAKARVGGGGPFGYNQASGAPGGHRAERARSAAVWRPGDRRSAVAVPDHRKRSDVPAAALLPSRHPARRHATRTPGADGAPDD